MEERDAENFDKFIESHWGANLVYNPVAEREAVKEKVAN